jgi:hypothetical protein
MGETEFFSDAHVAANEEIRKYARLSYNDMEMVNNMIDDILRTGKMSWYYRDKVDQSVRGEVGKKHIESIVEELKQKGRTTETDYFESKSNRVIGMDEFKGAIVPKQMSERIEQLLRDAGINKIFRYGSEQERKELFRRFPELAFATMAVPTGGLLLSEDDNQGKVSEGLLK